MVKFVFVPSLRRIRFHRPCRLECVELEILQCFLFNWFTAPPGKTRIHQTRQASNCLFLFENVRGFEKVIDSDKNRNFFQWRKTKKSREFFMYFAPSRQPEGRVLLRGDSI